MRLISIKAQVDPQDQALAEKAVQKILDGNNPLIQSLLTEMDQAAQTLRPLEAIRQKFSKFALVGIGGSSLGVQVFSQFFANRQFTYFDNVDAMEFETQIDELGDLKDVFWLFTSKSGETIETLAVLEFVDQIYSERNLSLPSNCAVVTESKASSLSEWARQRSVPHFSMPVQVGGRYSVLSAVGLVPGYLMGLRLSGLAYGAKSALTEQKILQNFVAAILSSFRRDEWITVLWGYSSRLKTYGLWWQQLWAESLAKKIDLHGKPAPRASTPLPLVGATDQHSVLQQVVEGHKDKFVIFLRCEAAEAGTQILKKSNMPVTQPLPFLHLGDLLQAEVVATQKSLTEVGVSNLTLQISDFSEESLGELMMFMQVAVLALGEALQIDPLNQPGVERGKVLCKKWLMGLQEAKTTV